MRIFRGNAGVEMTLPEFSEMIQDDDAIDELLDLIYELEMEEMDNEDYKEFEDGLLEQMDKYQKRQDSSSDQVLMKRILGLLDKYADLGR